MTTIPRDRFLTQLIKKKDNGLVKVITGVRRCGKSFLLFNLFGSYLNSIGVGNDRIIRLPLDTASNARYRNPLLLDEHIRDLAAGTSDRLYVCIDEIQLVR